MHIKCDKCGIDKRVSAGETTEWCGKALDCKLETKALTPYPTSALEQKVISDFNKQFKGETMDSDSVNHPAHYNLNHKGIECIDAMEAMLTPEEFRGYLRGNSFKYRWRYRYKHNPVQDLEKAMWYENRLMEFEKENHVDEE